MDREETRMLVTEIGNAVREHVAEKLGPLEKRVAELEAVPELKHAGVYKQGKFYKSSNLVTHQGGLWIARRNTTALPGNGDARQLVVKSGRA